MGRGSKNLKSLNINYGLEGGRLTLTSLIINSYTINRGKGSIPDIPDRISLNIRLLLVLIIIINKNVKGRSGLVTAAAAHLIVRILRSIN